MDWLEEIIAKLDDGQQIFRAPTVRRLVRIISGLQKQVDGARSALAAALAENRVNAEEADRLRAALEAVETYNDGLGRRICLWCRGVISGGYTEGHAPDCQRQAALSPKAE